MCRFYSISSSSHTNQSPLSLCLYKIRHQSALSRSALSPSRGRGERGPNIITTVQAAYPLLPLLLGRSAQN
ncbi:hypothetical protein EON65_58340 [archaeon]|nr:MAG: hypothetical protein EON65_58340 [archaeon]